ncbi:autotransporter-associated beta strand repeat-containing protein [Cryomorphaceae bacterium 1068]|nr:autotransporter-associated beta strand repeat-containing protein [Cryomorphaceae bacterium 1068]
MLRFLLRTTSLLLLLFAVVEVQGQFSFSDNATNYGGSWTNGSNNGTGYNAWSITSGGGTAGTFIGDPAANGMGTIGIGSTAFGLFGHSGVFVNAVRFFGENGTNVSMQIGDQYSFYWAMNWDAGSGSKGFDLRAGGATVFNVNNGSSATITTTNGVADGAFGTSPMLVTLTRTSWTEYSFLMTRRSDGSTYSTTISSSQNIDNINIYIGAQPDPNGNRNIFFNDFSFIKAHNPYEIQSNVIEPRTLTGSSTLTKTGTDILTLDTDNPYTGVTTVSQGTLEISGNMASSEIIVNSGATLSIQGNVSINDLTINSGGTVIQNGFTLTVNGDINSSGTYDFNGGGSPLIVNGDLNIIDGNFSLSSNSGGDLQLTGDFNKTGGAFNCNNRQIQFNGTTDQTYQSNTSEEIDFFLNSNTAATLTILSDATVSDFGNNWIFGASSNTIISAGVTITHGDNAVFTANNGGALVQVFGTIRNAGGRGADYFSLASILIIESGGVYEHNMTRSVRTSLGEIPAATWSPGSLCLINGLTNPNNGVDFSSSSEEQPFSSFEWNCPAQSANVSLTGSTITTDSFTMTSTGTGGLGLGAGTSGTIDCTNYTQTGGTINFASGSGAGRILCSAQYSHTGGTLTETSSGSGLVEFDGTASQTVTSTGAVNNEVSFRVNNPVGINIQNGSTININADAFFYRTQGAVTTTGSGSILYQPDGRLSYDGIAAITTANGEFPLANGPSFLEINNAAGVSLHAGRALAGGLFFTDGLLSLGANDLELESGATILGSPSASSHVNTNGTGELVRVYGASESGIFGYPIGENGFAPVFLDLSNGGTPRDIGLRAVDGNHPDLNNPAAQTNYLSRYWVGSNSAGGSYSYDLTLGYETSDVNGTESLIKINRWNGTVWSHIGSTANTAANLLATDVTLDEVSEPISGTFELTGRVKPRELTETSDFDEFTTIEPTPSPEQSFDISGTALTGDVTITAPTGFSVSLTSGGPFTASVSITPPGGNLAATTVYVQLNGTTEGAFSGNLTLASPGLTSVQIPLIGTVLSPNTVIIDFDDVTKWNAGSSGNIDTYSNDHTYLDNDWEFTGGPARRRNTVDQDGVPSALDNTSWNLQNNSSVVWTATYSSDGTANSFGFKVRRWDDSPQPNFIVEYSTNGGSLYNTAIPVLNNTFLGNTSKWKTFNFNLPTPVTIGVNELIIRVSALSSTGHIFIDDFSFDVTPNSCAQPNLFFRSKNSGNWTNRGTWETSTTGLGGWSDAQCAPDSDASQEITIRNSHTVNVGSDIDFEFLIIENGGRLLHEGGDITMNPGTGPAEIVVESGGIYELDGGNEPIYNGGAEILVQSGGVLRISNAVGGISDAMAGDGSLDRVFYENDAVFEWNAIGSFATGNQDYFPNATLAEIPIFRLSQNVGTVGAGTATTVNGIFEANANISWQNSGIKTFRNGITGSGNVTQSASPACGTFRITGDAVLGGTGILSLNNNDLEIASGAIVDLTSDKTINSTGSTNPNITINGILNDNGFSIPGDYNSVTMSNGSEVNVENEFGFAGTGGTFANTSAIFNLADASVVDYQRAGAQEISGINYGDVVVRGLGLKSCDGLVETRGIAIAESASLGSEAGAELRVEHHFIFQSPATFDQSAYDELTLSMVSTIDASVNSWTDVRCLNFTANTSNDINLIGGFSQLEIKNSWDNEMTSSGVFTDNGIEIIVGGNAFVKGGVSNYNLTGTLRFVGEQSTQSLQGSTSTAQVFAEINELVVSGGPNPPNVNIPTSSGITVKGDVTIAEGTLAMGSGILTLGGNWTNYNQSGFSEGISRVLFNGTGFQDITCPGGEVFSSMTTINADPTGGIRLQDGLSLTGINSNILDMISGSIIDIQDHTLAINGSNGGAAGTNLRVNDGLCTILSTNPSVDSRVLIQNGTKEVLSVNGGSLQLENPLTVRLESGLNCGTPDITTVSGVLEIANGGFIETNPPVYTPISSRLRYVATPNYTKGSEWNATSGQGFPNDVEVRGTNLSMNINTPHETARHLQISEGGTLNIGNNGGTGNLTIGGNVEIGTTGTGNLILGNNFGGDLFVKENFSLLSGTFNPNDREVIMINGASSTSSISGVLTFDFLAVNFTGGTVSVTDNLTINNRLRLTEGAFDFTTSNANLIMEDNSKILREATSSTIDKEPLVVGSDQYDIEYTGTMTSSFEFSSDVDAVDELFLNGASGSISVALNDDRTFNGDLRMVNSTLDLGNNTLSAAENVAGAGAFDAQIIVDGVDTCRVTGSPSSVFQAIGTGGTDPGFRTKQVVSQNNTKLLFEEDVLVRIGNGGFDFGTGNPTKIDGILEVAGGGYAILNSCYYGNSSLLRFANGFSYVVDADDVTWDNGDIASGNPGIPYNVESSGDASTDLTLNSPRSLRNDLTITGSQFTLTTNSGTFEIGGDWNRSGATSAFNPTGQEVIFNGTESQTINTFGGVASEVFFKLTFANTGVKTLQEDVTVLDELKIESNGNLNINGQELFLGGNWNNLAGESAVTETGTVHFVGSEVQTISSVGEEVFDDIVIQNTSELAEGVQLVSDIRINGNADFLGGIIHPLGGEEVIFGSNVLPSGGALNSYVNGVVRKDGFASTVGIFPVGYFEVVSPGDTVSVWSPAGIIASSTNAALEFSIEYIHQNYLPGTSFPSNPPPLGPGLVSASTCNYWEVNRFGPAIDAQLQLQWKDSTTCYDIQDPADLRVARWNGSEWEDVGGSGIAPIPYTVGAVTSGTISSFSPFTIATSNTTNVLPITLLSFQAEVKDDLVHTNWITASEINNDFFTVERSKDGSSWEEVGTVEGAGDSNTELAYAFVDDAPYSGISYYRLRQTDFDGTTTVSEIRAVEILQGSDFGLDKVYRGQDGLNLVYRSTAPYVVVEIYDLLGKRIHGELLENYGNGFATIHPDLARGAYVLKLSHGSEMDTEKFVW